MKPEIAIEKMRDVIRRKHLSLSTEENYLQWLVRFMRFVVDRCREGKPEAKMEAFLTQLARQDVSASTQNQAFCALLFFYREVLKVEVGTHCLNGGQNPRAIQQAMGHSSLETTMGYLHAEAMSVRSPLELVVS